jgi:hypothetical protein
VAGGAGLDIARIRRRAASRLIGPGLEIVDRIGAEVAVTIEIDARLPNGASDQLVRTVTENSRTLKFDSQGFETE